MKRLLLANGTISKDARAAFKGCELTGYENLLTPTELTGVENLLTPGMMKKTMALKKGYKNAVLDEQEKQDASGYCDPDRLARAAENYSRWATERALKIAIMNHASVTMSSR